MTVAFVFPGQGSQSVGMLAELAASFPLVGETFAEASAALGYDLWQLVQDGPAEELNNTRITQPAMLSAGIAVWRIMQDQGQANPDVLAGHSLGEYSALVAAGIDLSALAAVLVLVFLPQVMRDGFFHADLHQKIRFTDDIIVDDFRSGASLRSIGHPALGRRLPGP